MAMHSIYIVRSAAAPLSMCMRVSLGGVVIIYYYLHPALGAMRLITIKKVLTGSVDICYWLHTRCVLQDYSTF